MTDIDQIFYFGRAVFRALTGIK